MITGDDIRGHVFKSAGKGLLYASEVEGVLEAASNGLDEYARELAQAEQNSEDLYERVEGLANALSQLRSERELVQRTLLMAQRTADEATAKAESEAENLRTQARAEAERLKQESTAEAQRVVSEAKSKVEEITLRARAKADLIVEQAGSGVKQEAERIAREKQQQQEAYNAVRLEAEKFRQKMVDLLQGQLRAFESMPAYAPAEDTDTAADSRNIPAAPPPRPAHSYPAGEEFSRAAKPRRTDTSTNADLDALQSLEAELGL
ncbi:MAG: DivIVA domain-containing protein [Oscillospiraceae bacterium]|jgi:cell division septum initiation protein DivIVA|nr:DivIVA domain-containing protein [Oscillospiraceae bacterium]